MVPNWRIKNLGTHIKKVSTIHMYLYMHTTQQTEELTYVLREIHEIYSVSGSSSSNASFHTRIGT